MDLSGLIFSTQRAEYDVNVKPRGIQQTALYQFMNLDNCKKNYNFNRIKSYYTHQGISF